MSLHGNFVSVKEAAEIIGCTDSNVRRMIAAGSLAAVRLTERAYAVRMDSAQKAAKNPSSTGRPRSNKPAEAKNKDNRPAKQ